MDLLDIGIFFEDLNLPDNLLFFGPFAPGFKVDLLYSVPRDKEGSWVSMAADPKGRLFVSDQHGKLYRVTVGAVASDT